MKKLFSILVIGLFLSIPSVGHATPLLGTGQLHVSWSTPTSGGSPNYYADYDGTVVASDFGYTTDLEEIFCVSEDPANRIEDVEFYAIRPELDNDFGAGFYTKLARAAWIADNWTSYITPGSSPDTVKGEAQKAVWKVTYVMDRLEGSGIDFDIYSAAKNISGYRTNNWYYAHSAGESPETNFQDYLTPTAPVPEPATMLLLGTGLVGIAGLGRRKFFK